MFCGRLIEADNSCGGCGRKGGTMRRDEIDVDWDPSGNNDVSL